MVFYLSLLSAIIVGVCAQNFPASIIARVGEIKNITSLKDLECNVYKVERNTSYDVLNVSTEKKVIEHSTLKSKYPLFYDIPSKELTFTIRTFDGSAKPARFSFVETTSANTSVSFDIMNNYVTVRFENATHEWETTEGIYSVLPENKATKFSFYFSDTDIRMDNANGTLLTVPLDIAESHKFKLIVHNKNAAMANWIIEVPDFGRHRIYVDEMYAYCSIVKRQNDTNNDNNSTATALTTIIESQYRIAETMAMDAFNFRTYAKESDLTREFLNELLADIKENYAISKALNARIVTSYSMNRYEIEVKSKYLQQALFKRIRSMYFELVKSIDLVLSKFN